MLNHLRGVGGFLISFLISGNQQPEQEHKNIGKTYSKIILSRSINII